MDALHLTNPNPNPNLTLSPTSPQPNPNTKPNPKPNPNPNEVWTRFTYASSFLDDAFLPRRGLPRAFLAKAP